MAEAVEKKPHPVVVFREQLESRADTYRNALPPHIKVDRFIASMVTAVQLNPDLLACDRRSLFLASIRCAQDGLLPDGSEGAIVPFKKTATYIPMVQGLLKKFRNSGQFKWVTAGIAYEGEVYEHWLDETGEHFKHVPQGELADPKKIKRVYALATTKDGGFFVTDASMAEINKRRNMSRASRDDAPWKVWPDEMMKKTALRMLSKLLPKSSDLDQFLQRDEDESLGIEHATAAIEEKRALAFGSAMDHFAGPEETAEKADKESGTSPADGGTPAPSAETAAIQASPLRRRPINPRQRSTRPCLPKPVSSAARASARVSAAVPCPPTCASRAAPPRRSNGRRAGISNRHSKNHDQCDRHYLAAAQHRAA